jgi:hypothetical protein
MPFQSIYEVKPGSSLNITCVAGGSPMPYVKWRKGLEDLEPEHSLPIGRNILVLEDIQESANYTCVAFSKLGQVENSTFVRLEGKGFETISSHLDVRRRVPAIEASKATWNYFRLPTRVHRPAVMLFDQVCLAVGPVFVSFLFRFWFGSADRTETISLFYFYD